MSVGIARLVIPRSNFFNYCPGQRFSLNFICLCHEYKSKDRLLGVLSCQIFWLCSTCGNHQPLSEYLESRFYLANV